MSFLDTYETSRIRHEKARAQREAQKKYYDSLSPDELAKKLRKSCKIDEINDINDLKDRLLNQALTLDSVFFTALHQAGLGQESSLSPEALKMALHSQRLCRQTFDTLKKSQKSKNRLKNDEKPSKNKG